MQITIEYLVQFLGELLKDRSPAEEKVRLVDAFYHAALNHLPKSRFEKKKLEKRKEKKQKKVEKALKKRR